jgi:hypothetical protein
MAKEGRDGEHDREAEAYVGVSHPMAGALLRRVAGGVILTVVQDTRVEVRIGFEIALARLPN